MAALKLVSSAVRATRHVSRIPSPRQQQVNANLSLISRTWSTLTDSQRQGFIDLSKVWSPSGKLSSGGMRIFQSLNGVLLNTGLGNMLTDAPLRPDFIGKLPPFGITATLATTQASGLSLSSNAPADPPVFSLIINSANFTGAVQVLATRPLSAGVTQASQRQFIQIGVLSGLSVSTDIAGIYLPFLPAPAVDSKIAIQLIPLSPNGFRGNPFTQIVTVTAAP